MSKLFDQMQAADQKNDSKTVEALGKQVLIVNGQPTPRNLKFLDPTNRLKAIGVDLQFADLTDYEVLIVLDTSAWAQLGPMADVVRGLTAKKLIVDHHVSSDDLEAEEVANIVGVPEGAFMEGQIRKNKGRPYWSLIAQVKFRRREGGRI